MCEVVEEIIGNQKDEENFFFVLLIDDLVEVQVKNRIRRRLEVKGKRKLSLIGRNFLLLNLRKKRSLLSVNFFVVFIIVDNDENDFEGVNIFENIMSDII